MNALLARLTKLEDQIRSGCIAAVAAPQVPTAASQQPAEAPVHAAAPEVPVDHTIVDEAPIGFWADVVSAVKEELSVSMRGFFATSENAMVKGILSKGTLILTCTNKFTLDIINKPDIIELISRKASAKLGKPVRVVVTDDSGYGSKSEQLEELVNFGKKHSDIVSFTNNNE